MFEAGLAFYYVAVFPVFAKGTETSFAGNPTRDAILLRLFEQQWFMRILIFCVFVIESIHFFYSFG
jgi:hypothetical protein